MGEYQGTLGEGPDPLGGWPVYQSTSHTFWKVTCHTHDPMTRTYRGHRTLWAREKVHPRGPADCLSLSLAPCSLGGLHRPRASVPRAARQIRGSTGVVTTQVCLSVFEGNSVLREYISWEEPALFLVKVPTPPPQDPPPASLQEPLFQRDLSLFLSFLNPKMTLRNLDFLFCLKNKQTKSVGSAHVGSRLKGPSRGCSSWGARAGHDRSPGLPAEAQPGVLCSSVTATAVTSSDPAQLEVDFFAAWVPDPLA